MSTKILSPDFSKRPLYIIGLNSGTSADGLDLVLAKFAPSKLPEVLKYETYSYPIDLTHRIIALAEPEFVDGVEWMALDYELGGDFGKLAKAFASKIIKAGGTVDLVGSHGQTIRHLPDEYDQPLTLQVGDPTLIAKICGLPVVADFRRSDIAAGGEGAPLSPILHEALFRSKDKWRAIVNIGGIANITILPPLGSSKNPVAGDSGPGNMSVDLAMKRLFDRPFDFNGNTAQTGNPITSFVSEILKAPFFLQQPPKSTGRELFGSSFLESAMDALRGLSPEDIIATLSMVTIASIAEFIHRFGPNVEEIYLCGGGAKNLNFRKGLMKHFPLRKIETTAVLGYNPDYLEALLWAYLAYCFITESPINPKHFTGAKRPYIPGKLCLP